MSLDKDKVIYIGCKCHSPYHIMSVSLWDWSPDGAPELSFVLQADHHLGFWGRLKAAALYLFSIENLGWHDVLPNHEDILKLSQVIDNYNEAYKIYEDKEKVKA
jgi:hypothetical protein